MQIKKPGGKPPVPAMSPRAIVGPPAPRAPVAQLKVFAPPVYRPNPTATQPRMQAGASIPSRPAPGAPPVYAPRMSPVTAAPPVYRPDANMKVALTKTTGRGGAPPVYRPNMSPAQKKATIAPVGFLGVNHASQAATTGPPPPVYRPAPPCSIKTAVSPHRSTASSSYRGNVSGTLQPKVFNRQQDTFFTSPVQNSRIGSSQMPSLLAAHRSVSQGATIQRLVILVSRDPMAEKNYQNLVDSDPSTDPTHSLREGDHSIKGKPLDQLGVNESLHVVTHGDGQGHVEGQDDQGNTVQMNASEFLSFLIQNGLKRTHKGAIRLLSCFSGTRTSSGTTFAEEFTILLRNRGFENRVIAFDGLVGVKPGAHIGVVPPSKVKEYDMLRNVDITLNEEFQALLKKPSSKSGNERMQEILKLRKKWVAESNDLFKPQNLTGDDPNIVYFPTGPAPQSGPSDLSKQRAAREWEEWHQGQLRNFNMVDSGPSSTPSYIS